MPRHVILLRPVTFDVTAVEALGVVVATDDLDVQKRWITGTDRIRIVGSNYDPDDDPNHKMIDDPANWFDRISHHKTATSFNFLD